MEKLMKNLTILALAVLAIALPIHAQQHAVLATTLSAAITSTATRFNVASATGINAPTLSAPAQAGTALYVVDIGQTRGELMMVTAISSTSVTVSRTQSRAVSHASGAMVLVATAANWFSTVDPLGSCVTATVYASPYVNTSNGNQWICSSKTLTWVPYWGTPNQNPQLQTATATASVAGATAIIGPLVEISGTEAITSFTMSTGWNGQGFCIQPTAAFTTVAGNNIAEASTADANQTLCYVWNAVNSNFSASY